MRPTQDEQESIAEAIASKIITNPMLGERLWDIKTISHYLCVSDSHCRQQIVYSDSFPKAIRLPSKKGIRAQPRWYAKEVRAWVKRYHGSQPIGRPRASTSD